MLGNLSHSPNSQDFEIIADYESFATSLQQNNLSEMPAPLAKHAAFSSDLSLYIEGSGCARILESGQNPSVTALSKILPIFDPFLQHSLGLFIDSSQGEINLKLRNQSSDPENLKQDVPPLSIIEQLPGDVPIVARISIPEKKFQETLVRGADLMLKFFSSNKLNADSLLPGFDLSAKELLSFPTGDFVFAGGHADIKRTLGSDGQSRIQSILSYLSGMKIRNSLAYKELMSGIKQGMSISSMLGNTGLTFVEHPESLWLTTTDFQREIELNKPIHPFLLIAESFSKTTLLPSISYHQKPQLHYAKPAILASIY